VADASNPAVLEQISAVYSVLEELGIEEKGTVLVLNKIDRMADRGALGPILRRYPNALPISAHTGEGLDELHQKVSDALSRSFVELDVETDAGNGKLLAFLAAHAEILERRYEGERVFVHCRIPERHLGGLRHEGTVVRPRNGALAPAESDDGSLHRVSVIEDVA
jgi:GTP-binding protein HflX